MRTGRTRRRRRRWASRKKVACAARRSREREALISGAIEGGWRGCVCKRMDVDKEEKNEKFSSEGGLHGLVRKGWCVAVYSMV